MEQTLAGKLRGEVMNSWFAYLGHVRHAVEYGFISKSTRVSRLSLRVADI